MSHTNNVMFTGFELECYPQRDSFLFVGVVAFAFRYCPVIWLCCLSPQKCKSLHFPTKTVEMPSTDALQYMMYKTLRGALPNLKDSLDETLEREFNRISDKGAVPFLQLIHIKMIICSTILTISVCLRF